MIIYLSSTSTDLVDFRVVVARVLRQMGHEVIGMEEYVAEGTRPLDRCLKDVERADLYVGIFAWRYWSCSDSTTGWGNLMALRYHRRPNIYH